MRASLRDSPNDEASGGCCSAFGVKPSTAGGFSSLKPLDTLLPCTCWLFPLPNRCRLRHPHVSSSCQYDCISVRQKRNRTQHTARYLSSGWQEINHARGIWSSILNACVSNQGHANQGLYLQKLHEQEQCRCPCRLSHTMTISGIAHQRSGIVEPGRRRLHSHQKPCPNLA